MARRGIGWALLLAVSLPGCSGRPFGDADGEAALQGEPWEWTAGGTASRPAIVGQPERYTIEFLTEYRVKVRADCNRGVGPWGVDGGKVTIGPLTMSKRVCGADSRGKEFKAGLEAADRWFVRDGSLFLALPHDRGALRLARGGAPVAQ
jgi:heat shock protein HslJ